MSIKRKEFLQLSSMASASMFIPSFVKGLEIPLIQSSGQRVLVIIQFSGGNDGLNTVIPIQNDIYYKGRPSLAINKQTALSVTDDVGLHPAMPFLKTCFDTGKLAILNAVGYPEPDRSHFRSMDIWHTASNSNEYLKTGWLGRYLDAQCSNCEKPTQIIEVDDLLSLALKGEQYSGMAFREPVRLKQITDDPVVQALAATHDHSNETASYLYKTLRNTVNSASYVYEQNKLSENRSTYPDTPLGRDLKTIARLIASPINTKVYYASIGSFDTHVNQASQQNRLFTEFNGALEAFIKDLEKQQRFQDVLIMTFSEFGRRVNQNASNGTDHGTANNMFLLSGSLKRKGMLNQMPDLNDLIEGDLKHTVDFKQVYATILKKWLLTDDKKIIGDSYPSLDFI